MFNKFSNIAFSEIILTSRKLKGWTVKELIAKLEAKGQRSLSPAYITRIEQYGEIPSPELILMFADLFKLNPEKLLASAKKAKVEAFDKSLEEKYEKALKVYDQKK